MKLLTLADLQAVSTSKLYDLGVVAAVFDATYGSLKAIYCRFQDALTVVGAPVYPDIAAGWKTSFIVDEDENESGVIGQEFCIGVALSAAAVATAFYGWVLSAGICPLALTTDGAVAAAGTLIGSTTDGTWNSVAETVSQAVAESGSASYTILNVPEGKSVGLALAADTSTTLAAGDAQIRSILAGLPETL